MENKEIKSALRKEFPGIKFRVFGYDHNIEWFDGPTSLEVEAFCEGLRIVYNTQRKYTDEYLKTVVKHMEETRALRAPLRIQDGGIYSIDYNLSKDAYDILERRAGSQHIHDELFRSER